MLVGVSVLTVQVGYERCTHYTVYPWLLPRSTTRFIRGRLSQCGTLFSFKFYFQFKSVNGSM